MNISLFVFHFLIKEHINKQRIVRLWKPSTTFQKYTLIQKLSQREPETKQGMRFIQNPVVRRYQLCAQYPLILSIIHEYRNLSKHRGGWKKISKI